MDDYFRNRESFVLVFWTTLITREDRLYHQYAWQSGYGEKDEWLETWRG